MVQSIRRISVVVGALALLGALLASPAAAFVNQERGQAWRNWGIGQHLGHPSKDSDGTRIPGRYIVVFKDSVRHPGTLAAKQADEVGAKVGIVYHAALKGYAAAMSSADAAALRSDSSVRYVAPDRLVELASQTMPGGIDRIGVPENSSLAVNGKEDVQVDADIAIIDSGIDYENSELNVFARTDCVPPGEDYWEEYFYKECVDEQGRDLNRHGTHVAGIAAALDNGEGVVGVAPGARLWSVRVMTMGGIGSQSWIAAGIDWVTEHAEQIEVANLSLGCICSMPPVEDAIEAASKAGVVVVVAAGNEGTDAKDFSPAKNPYAIAVSATTLNDLNTDGLKPSNCAVPGAQNRSASFSNYGNVVDVAAPGTCIYSTLPENGYSYLQGTSMAAPHVAGAAAILASRDNPEDLEDVEAISQDIQEEGSSSWTDTSPDGIKEPLLDVSNAAVFHAKGHPITRPATVQSKSKVTLRGLVNPEGVSASYRFEYGTTTGYGSKVPASPKSIGSGTTYVSVEEPLEGLQGQTLYHYRVVVTSSAGTFYGNDEIFSTTPPEATGQSASDISANGATLNATVDPKGIATTYQFEYGKTTAYDHRRPLFPQSIGTEKSEVHEGIGFLSGNETYHYRLVLRTAAGVVYGEDQTFNTPAEPTPWVSETADEDTAAYSYTLRDVSCTSATFCMAVGRYRPKPKEGGTLQDVPLAERWDGEEWSRLPVPNPAPSNGYAFFSGVSCTSPSWCVAVGLYGVQGSSPLIIQEWDGEQWSERSIPEISVGNVNPPTVSCVSASECMMVAVRIPGDDVGRAWDGLAGEWNGTEWSFGEVAKPAGSSTTGLYGVSCPSASSCVAVGGYTSTTKEFPSGSGPLAVYWNGDEWSVIQSDAVNPATETPRRLRSVACITQKLCTVSMDGGEKVERWNGESWSVEAVPEPVGVTPGTQRTENDAVSCLTAASCVVVGAYGEERSYQYKPTLTAPRRASLSGKDWTLASGPGPVDVTEPGAREENALTGVSCVTNRCVAVGWANSGHYTARIESYLVPEVDSDVDGDGHSDLVTMHPDGSVTVHGGGEGEAGLQFAAGVDSFSGEGVLTPALFIGEGDHAVDVADVTGDRRSDLITVTDDGDAHVYAGEEGGTFEEVGTTTELGLTPALLKAGGDEPIAAADVSGDGHADLVLYDDESDHVTVYPGSAAGTFGTGVTTSETLYSALHTASGEYLLDAADVTGDGRADLVSMTTWKDLYTRAGKADGTFAAPVSSQWGSVDPALDNGSGREPIGVGDVTGDGKADLVLTQSSTVYVYPAQGGADLGRFGSAKASGGTTPSTTFGTSPGFEFPGVLDVDANGRADIVLAHTAGRVYVSGGQSDGSFKTTASVSFAEGFFKSTQHFKNQTTGSELVIEKPALRRRGCASNGCHHTTASASPASGFGATGRGGGYSIYPGEADGDVLQRWWSAEAGWSSWGWHGSPPGGQATSESAATSTTGADHVFVRGAAGALWQKSWSDEAGKWSEWASLGGELATGPGPAAVSRETTKIDVFARSAADKSAIRKSWSSGSGWGSWETVSGTTGTTGLGVASRNGGLDLYMRDAEGNVAQRWWTSGTGWSGPGGHGSPPGGPTTSAPAAISPTSGSVHVFVRGADRALWEKVWTDASGKWSEWTSLGGVLRSGPSVTSPAAGQIHLFARAANDSYWRKRWSAEAGWSEWEPVF